MLELRHRAKIEDLEKTTQHLQVLLGSMELLHQVL
jgi:hypothetical protein